MRILLLTQWFTPEPQFFKSLPFAKALQQCGHEVEVITGFPNYPNGSVYPGYRIRPFQREVLDGVRITRVALYPSHDGSVIRRALNYASFATTAALAGVSTRFRPAVVHVYHPPLTVGLAASAIGLMRRVPFVFDIQDLWPDSLEATGMVTNRRVLNGVGRLAQLVYKQASLLIAQSPGFVASLTERGVPKDKIRLIYNWCDEKALGERAPLASVDLRALAGRFNLVFAGTMGRAQALKAVLEAAVIVRQRAPEVQFVFVGGGTEVEDLKAYARQRELSNTLFMPQMAMNEVGHVLDAADALLVHLRDAPLFRITLPSKTQAYLFAGKPVLMAAEGNAADLISTAQAGICAKPEDPSSIVNAVMQLAAMPAEQRQAMGERGKRFYNEELSLKAGTQRTIKVFEEAVALHRDRPRKTRP